MTDDLPDGIWFDMPMDTYVALPRLGAHSLGSLLVSAATYWAGSHLNPAPREVSAAVEATRTIGSAYHCARLEPEHFEARYVRELVKEDLPEGALITGADMGGELAEMGLKKSGSVEEQAWRLHENGCTKPIWFMQLRAWEQQRNDRIALSPRTWDEIKIDGQRLRQSPEVAALLDGPGGFAEVTILWTDANGIKCKCRPDKLFADRWLDFKTFTNTNGKNLEQAITDAIRFNRYHVGAAHYREGIAAARAALTVQGEATEAQHDMVAALKLEPEFPACWYVFQEKGGIPNILAKQMRFHEVPLNTRAQLAGASDEARDRVEAATAQRSLWYERALREIRKAKRTFRTYSEVYAPGEPWLPFNPLGEISDLSFSSYFLDEEIGE